MGVSGNSYVSELSFIAFTELNRTTLSCSLSGLTEIGSDILTIGGNFMLRLCVGGLCM